jgi:molybdopterin molybdotransferase
MVVFLLMVRPLIERLGGRSEAGLTDTRKVPAVLSRNVASVQGRADYVRVKLVPAKGQVHAEPILGKSGLIHTMVKADGLIGIDVNSEGLDKGTQVEVLLF